MINCYNAAREYIKRGYSVFPCAPGFKYPFVGSKGLKEATNDLNMLAFWQNKFDQGANLALVPDERMFVLDLDCKDGTVDDGWTWVEGLDNRQRQELYYSPWQDTPSGGRHFPYALPDGNTIKQSAGKIAPGIDIRTNAGYILVAPSMVNGKSYRWGSMLPHRDKLPIAPAWLVDLANADHKPVATTANDTWDGGTGMFADILEGTRDNTLYSVACRFRNMGFGDEMIYRLLQEVNEIHVKPPMSDGEIRRIAMQSGKVNVDEVAVMLTQDFLTGAVARGIAENGEVHDPVEILLNPQNIQESRVDEEELPVSYKDAESWEPLNREVFDEMPYVMRDVFDAIHYRSESVVPEVNFGATLALFGTLYGRQFRCYPRGNFTNQYIVSMARTGIGKNAGRKMLIECLQEIAPTMCGPEAIGSHVGLATILQNARPLPNVICAIDEFGQKMTRWSDGGKGNGGLGSDILSTITALYSHQTKGWYPQAKRDARDEDKVDYPCLHIYGTTTQDSFFNGLKTAGITDGTLGRFLLFESNPSLDEETKKVGDGPVPQSFKAHARAFVPDVLQLRDAIEEAQERADADDVDLLAGDLNGLVHLGLRDPIDVRMDEFAKQEHEHIRQRTKDKSRGESDRVTDLWIRTAEKVNKIALIKACAESFNPSRNQDGSYVAQAGPEDAGIVITLSDIQWAEKVVTWCHRLAVRNLSYVVDNEFQAQMRAIWEALPKDGSWIAKAKFNKRKTTKFEKRDLVIKRMAADKIVQVRREPTKGTTATFYARGVDLMDEG